MGISIIGGAVASSSPIKSIQRGVTTSGTTVTIAAVDPAKSFVNSFSDLTTGDVSTSYDRVAASSAGAYAALSVNFPTTWAARAYGAYLQSGTELVTTGAVRWEVIEYV